MTKVNNSKLRFSVRGVYVTQTEISAPTLGVMKAVYCKPLTFRTPFRCVRLAK